jgi:acyl-CoA thioester hydrolase
MQEFDVYRGAVNTWECDEMGHMNVQHYVAKISHAWAHLRSAIGMPASTIREDKVTVAAVRDFIQYRREVHAGDALHMTARVIEVGDKTVRFGLELWRSDTGELSAKIESTGIFFDLKTRKAGKLPPLARERALALRSPRPDDRPPPTPDPRVAGASDDRLYETYRGSVNTWECDYLGHMNIQFYTSRFSDAGGHIFGAIGLPHDGRIGTAAVQYDIQYRREVKAGAPLLLRSGLLGLGTKSMRFMHRLSDAATGEIYCTVEIVAVALDLATRKAVPISDAVRAAGERRLVPAV